MKRIGILLLIFSFHGSYLFSQDQQDTIRQKKTTAAKASQQFMNRIRKAPPDSLIDIKGEIPFLPYEGKIIRKIIINQIGFERVIPDTSRWIKSTAAKVGNRLHNDSKSWVIRNNLFIREGKPLNPYRLADNERYLRDLEFILDSRIFVLPLSEESDSVDLLVMTRDVFSLGAAVIPRSGNEYFFRMQEANLGGMGQKLSVAGVYDYERTPKTGYEFLYQKTNLFGSFINATVAYTEINTARSVGEENEYGYFFRLDRPLYNPFARWTGALELSRNWSKNNFDEEENSFKDYQYDIKDVWAGYSFGLKKLFDKPKQGENRNRTFVALRAFDQAFSKMPDVTLSSNDSMIYTDRSNVLGQLSFFKQNFYKTHYVLGFGRTEDVPYGYRFSFTGGWEKERGIQRAYTGAEVMVSTVNTNGTFYTYKLKLGNYLSEDLIEDALAEISVGRYSRLYILGKNKIRSFAELEFASQLNQTIKPDLDINDINGIRGFKPDSLSGSKRLRLRTETVIFTPWKLLGFHLAPVANIDLAYLGQEYQPLMKKENFYSGFAAAMRARNENLIFNTVEARVYYYPKTVEGIDHWRAEFRVNLRIKYPTAFVTAPATVYNP
jgi:hypothetical protein